MYIVYVRKHIHYKYHEKDFIICVYRLKPVALLQFWWQWWDLYTTTMGRRVSTNTCIYLKEKSSPQVEPG